MRFIVNTSVMISALIKKKSISFRAPTETKHELYIPEYSIEELIRHIKKIEERSELTSEEILARIILIINKIIIVSKDKVILHMHEAYKIIGHRDTKDAPFVATLLAIGGDGIVSYDNDFEEITKYGYVWLKPNNLL